MKEETCDRLTLIVGRCVTRKVLPLVGEAMCPAKANVRVKIAAKTRGFLRKIATKGLMTPHFDNYNI